MLNNIFHCFRLWVVAFLSITSLLLTTPLFAQMGEGWVDLLNGNNMDAWQQVGEANWRFEEGAVVADHRLDDIAHLITRDEYQDFQLYVEFWASHDANSGIFLRCTVPIPNPKACYEVNIFDQRGDPSYGTGGVVNFAEVDPMPKAGSRWNTYEITAQGRQIRVLLNRQETANFRNGMFQQGPISLQYGSGVLKFRKVAIKPL